MSRHVVLDVDECLLHTFTDDLDWKLYRQLKANPETKHRVGKITFGEHTVWFVKRPHLDSFLNFCFKHFETVSVWSAGIASYVEAVVAEIFKKRKPHLVMTRSNVLNDSIHKDVYAYSKPLMFYFERMPQATRENTILIDDRKSNSKYDPENIIHVPVYDVTQDADEIMQNDSTLPNLEEWLQRLEEGKDIRCFDHSQAFVGNVSLI